MKMVKLDLEDWFVIMTILLMIFTHSITIFTVNYRTSQLEEQQIINNALEIMEANPVAVWILRFNNLKYLFSYALTPALIGATYYWFRKKAPEYKGFIAMNMFIFSIINFSNDATILLAILMRGG